MENKDTNSMEFDRMMEIVKMLQKEYEDHKDSILSDLSEGIDVSDERWSYAAGYHDAMTLVVTKMFERIKGVNA